MAAAASAPPTTQSTRTRCGGTSKQTGKPCGHPAGYGTDHVGSGNCKFHGGATPNGAKHARKQLAADLAEQHGSDPHQAIQHELDFESALASLLERDLLALKPDEVLTGEQLHQLVRLRRESGDRRVRIAHVAVDAGVAERQMRLNEDFVGRLAAALDAVLTRLGVRDHPDAQAAVADAFKQIEQTEQPRPLRAVS